MKRIFVYSFILSLLLTISCSTKVEYLPESIFGISLTKILTDTEAEKFVNRLHFGNVAADKNEIAFYSGEKGNAVIYVSYYRTEKLADENLKLMVKKISPQNSVFTGGESFEMYDIRIYRYSGMGQTHFVFSHNKALLWISGEIGWAEQFLKEFLEFIS